MAVRFGQLLPYQLLYKTQTPGSPVEKNVLSAAKLPAPGHLYDSGTGIVTSSEVYTVKGLLAERNGSETFSARFTKPSGGFNVVMQGDPVNAPDEVQMKVHFLAADGVPMDGLPVGKGTLAYGALRESYRNDPSMLAMLADAVTLFAHVRQAPDSDYYAGFLAGA